MPKPTKAELKEQRKAEWQAKAAKQEKDAKIKKYAIWSGVALIVLGVVFIFYKAATSTPSSQTVAVPPVTKSDIATGSATSKAVLVEYADFQCPSCAAAYPLVKQLIKDEGDKVLYVYRFFPLTNAHQNAMISAQAGYAAYKQGKFWDMEDQLFTHQTDWAQQTDPQPIFVSYAQKLGIDTDKFKADMISAGTVKVVTDSMNSALTIGINSTPTFFLNGKIIIPTSYDDLKKQVNQALSSK